MGENPICMLGAPILDTACTEVNHIVKKFVETSDYFLRRHVRGCLLEVEPIERGASHREAYVPSSSEHQKNIMNLRRLPGQEIKAMHARQRLDESQSVRAQTLESVVA